MWVHLTNNGSYDLIKYDGEHFYLNSVGVNYVAVQLAGADLTTFSNIKLQIKYSDNSYSPQLEMVRQERTYPYETNVIWTNGNNYYVAVYNFNVAGVLGVAGQAVVSVTFYQSGVIQKTCSFPLYIEDTVIEEEQTITTTEYQEMQLDIVDRWKRFVGTSEEIAAEEKDIYTLYVDTTTNDIYYYSNSELHKLSEVNLSITADDDNHIKSISYNGTTYYPTKFIKFDYNGEEDTEIIEGEIPSLTDYNENYLYYNYDNNSYYRYDEGNESLMLTGNANCNFRLTYDNINDRYNLGDTSIVRLRKIAQSRSAAMFVMFQFVGGDYDGRKYLMNYNYNSTAHRYDFVCIDLDIDEEEQPAVLSSVEKFRLSLLDSATSGVYGVWYKVSFGS